MSEQKPIESPQSPDNQRICGKLVEREVLCCVSYLVSEIMRLDPDNEELYDLCVCRDYREAAEEAGWQWDGEACVYVNREDPEDYLEQVSGQDWEELCFEHSIEYEGHDRDPEEAISYGELADIQGDAEEAARAEGWDWDSDNERFIKPQRIDYIAEDDWEELCSVESIEPNEHEALEHWAVTGWLSSKLESEGEIVGNLCDLNIWGRRCSGQAIKLDTVIGEIASEMGILVGQPNSWAEPEPIDAADRALAKLRTVLERLDRDIDTVTKEPLGIIAEHLKEVREEIEGVFVA